MVFLMDDKFSILDISCASLLNASTTQQYLLFSFIVNGLGICSLVIFGLIGNVIIIAVLRSRSMKAKINQYLIALALADIMVLCTSFALFGWSSAVYGVEPATGVTFGYINFIFYPISNMARTASVWILLVTTVERFRAICFPMNHMLTATSQHGRRVLAAVCLAAVVVNIPRWFELTIGVCPERAVGMHLGDLAGELIIVISDLRANATYYLVYHVMFQQFFVTVGPFILQSVLTILVHQKMQTSSVCLSRFVERTIILSGNENQGNRRRLLEDNMTRMLLVIAGKFLLCLLMPIVVDSYEVFGTTLKLQFDEHFGYYVDLSTFLVITNSSVNFAIYMACCRRFKHNVYQNFKLFLTCGKPVPNEVGCEENAVLMRPRNPAFRTDQRRQRIAERIV